MNAVDAKRRGSYKTNSFIFYLIRNQLIVESTNYLPISSVVLSVLINCDCAIFCILLGVLKGNVCHRRLFDLPVLF